LNYTFDWNPVKEQQNIRKHQVSFRQAATVFRDPKQISIYDEEHSNDEERWATIGIDNTGVLRVVIHTIEQLDRSTYKIRIISARKANRNETRQYQGINL
jgi:hypothetical protein